MERCEVCRTRTVTREGVCAVCSTRPKDRVRRRHFLIVPAVTWAALGVTWLGILLYVHLVDIGHPDDASSMTGADMVNWTHRAVLVMLTGEGRAVTSPPELAVGLALVLQLASFLGLAVGGLRLYARRSGWTPRWREVLPGVLIAAAGVGAACVVLAQAVVPSMAPVGAFPVPFLITAGVLFSGLWPPQRSHDDLFGRIGAGVGLAWKLFALSLIPGVVMFVVGIEFFYGSWSVLNDLWGLYLLNSVPQDLIGAAAFTFGGLHDGFSGRTGLFTGDPHWGFQVFPLVQVWLAFVVGHRFVLKRRRGIKIGIELIFAGLAMVTIWTTVIWFVHFHADPRQYTKYTTGWGPDSVTSLACMTILMGFVFISLSATRGRLGGWAPRLSALIAGRSVHPTWAAALTERLQREGTRIPRRLASVEVTDEDRDGSPLPSGAMALFGALGFGATALALLMVSSTSVGDCGPMIRAAFVENQIVPDHQAPPALQEQIEAVALQLDMARVAEKEALAAAEQGRRLVKERSVTQQRFVGATRTVLQARGLVGTEIEDQIRAAGAVRALDDARRARASIAVELARLDRLIAREQDALDLANAATAEVRTLIGASVQLENDWRTEHMADYIAALDYNAQAEVCRAEGRSRLVGAGLFGGLAVVMLWVWVSSVRARRRVAAARN